MYNIKIQRKSLIYFRKRLRKRLHFLFFSTHHIKLQKIATSLKNNRKNQQI